MEEPRRHRPPHAGERLTRDDVLRLIEEHGGPEDLDLRQADLRQADLRDLDLHGARLPRANLQEANLGGANVQEANLGGANLREANLCAANLQGANLGGANLQGASLVQADLQGAVLFWADLQQADLRLANLCRADLSWSKLQGANLEGANWGDYKLGEESAGDFGPAASAYRALKQRHTELGMYDIAGEFHYREMEARRKQARRERRLPYALTLNALRFLYGYGERPERVIGWAAAIVFGLALAYWRLGMVAGGFLDALYYSAVSFPALGYGAWAPEPQGWAGRFLGVGESFIGVFMMALFLVTFTRKMTR
ncbi:MAG: pentapeptide repeat-containing protein [Chloroflexota bacterium]|nr:pentapeptide repeat-containing protein [Chloroflexota bacterium]